MKTDRFSLEAVHKFSAEAAKLGEMGRDMNEQAISSVERIRNISTKLKQLSSNFSALTQKTKRLTSPVGTPTRLSVITNEAALASAEMDSAAA